MPDEINPYNAGTTAPRASPFAPSPGEISEVVYELDIEDMIAFSLHHHNTSAVARSARRRSTILFLVVAAGCGLAGLGGIGNNDTGATILCLSAAGAFALLPFVFRPLVRRQMRRSLVNLFREGSNRALLGTRRLRLLPSGITDSSELIETTAKWAAVEKIETNEEYACLYIAAVRAFLVPRRAFGDEAQFLSFVELARRYRQQAGAAPTA
ncbi:MAG TPA: YcxB family protein [Pirellulales bacterium]|nr:YcxB family protein [Pirellulales bacterium]